MISTSEYFTLISASQVSVAASFGIQMESWGWMVGSAAEVVLVLNLVRRGPQDGQLTLVYSC